MRKRLWNHTTTQFLKSIAFIVAVVLLSSCATNRYITPVTSFRGKTQQTIGILGDFYSSRNSYEIDNYLQTIAADKNLKVEYKDSEGRPTPLGQPVFSPMGIKARLDALNLVGVYANRLYEVSNTDRKANFTKATTTLGESLSSLNETFKKLSGSSDPTAERYIGPVSSLIGTIGQMFLDQKREEMITQAVDDGAPQVELILSRVRDDMDRIFALQIATGAADKLATLKDAYNRDRADLTYEQRAIRLAEIKAAANAGAAGVGATPSSLVTSMMEAHRALVTFAKAPDDARPRSLAEFSTALNEWGTQMQDVAVQVKLLVD